MSSSESSVVDKVDEQVKNTWALRINWGILAVIALAVILSALHHTFIAVCCISCTSIVLGIMRLVLRDRSPWIVRSLAFDVFINIGLGIGLVVTYITVLMLLRG